MEREPGKNSLFSSGKEALRSDGHLRLAKDLLLSSSALIPVELSDEYNMIHLYYQDILPGDVFQAFKSFLHTCSGRSSKVMMTDI
jgi:hypothetical protein